MARPLVLQAFFDESGTAPEAPALILAGLISTRRRWKLFSSAWQALLDEWEIPYFHMTDFEAGVGHYVGWKDARLHQPRIVALLDLVCEYCVAAVSVAVSNDDFRRIYGPNAHARLRFALAARVLFNEVSKFDRHGKPAVFYSMAGSDRFAYVFESGAAGIGQVLRVFQRYYNNPLQRATYRLSSCELGDKRKLPPLQAADIVAFEGRAQWSRFRGFESRPTRYTYLRLSSIPHRYANLSIADMEAWKPDLLLAIQEGRL
jgi:hypothetical protein